MPDIPRREFITKGSTALAALAAFYASRHAYAFPSQPGAEVLPWLDQLPPNPVPDVIKNQLVWEDFNSWITPNDKFFSIDRSSTRAPGSSRSTDWSRSR